MLTEVDFLNAAGNMFTLVLADDTSGFYVEDIEGLGPVKAALTGSSFAQQDGQQFQSARRDTRNIVITAELRPDFVTTTVRDLRTQLYSYFMPKSVLLMTFTDDTGLVVNITGRVESCEPTLFAKEPSVDISIICFNPDFYDPTDVVVSGNTVADTTMTDVDYVGTTPAGIIFVLNVDRTIAGVTIYRTAPDSTTMALQVVVAMVSGDVLTVNTNPGSKNAVLTHSGVDQQILYTVAPGDTWIDLRQGTNYMRAQVSGAAIPYTVTYTTKYGGL